MEYLINKSIIKTQFLRCTKVPNDFFVNKALTKQHFRKFGKIKRMILKPKQRICICEYFDNASFLKALRKAGEYNGMVFKVVQDTSKPKKQIKDPDPDWPIDPDIQAELDAMAGTKNMRKQYNLRPESKYFYRFFILSKLICFILERNGC